MKKFKLLLALFLALLVWPGSSTAQIAFDATFSGSAASGTTLSWTHTCTGSNLILVVGVSQRIGLAITGITYNGVALTKIRSDDDGGSDRSELWYLIAPATGGAFTITVTITAPGSTFGIVGGSISLTGAKQSAQPDANNGATGNVNPTVNVTTVADNSWVIDTVSTMDAAPGAVGAGQTQRWSILNNFAGGGGSHEGPQTPPGAVTMSWTFGSFWTISAASFAPAVSTGPKNLPIIGVGMAGTVKEMDSFVFFSQY